MRRHLICARLVLTLEFLLSVACLTFAVWFAYKFGYIRKGDMGDVGRVFGTMWSVCAFVWVVYAMRQFIYVWFSPKVWLIKEIR